MSAEIKDPVTAVQRLFRYALGPWLLLASVLLLGLLAVSHPPVFEAIYKRQMQGMPEVLVADGLLIAETLHNDRPFLAIDKELVGGRIGPREVYHFEDIRAKLGKAQVLFFIVLGAFVIVSRLVPVKIGPACLAAVGWMMGIGVVGMVWSLIHFRQFFRALHWIIFWDDTWILPQACYSLKLYPYAVWQAAGVVLLVFTIFLLVLLYLASWILGRMLNRRSSSRQPIA